MSLARSTYYYRPRGRGRDEEALLQRIQAICEEFPRYGYRRVTAQLCHEGWRINHKRVARIMRERGLSVKLRRRTVRTSDGGGREAAFPNLARHFTPTGPNELWVGDITYIRTRSAFVYLAVILDAWSRRVVGYAVSRQVDTRLTIAALRAALADRQPPRGCIHHTDRGSQGEFKRSSQHLEEELRWRRGGVEDRIELYVDRCGHRAGPRWDVGSIGRGSGRRSLGVCRARRLPWPRVCRPLSGHAGSANVVACHPSSFASRRGAISHSSSEKRSPFFEPVVVACARSPGSWAAHPRRSRESCGATQRHGEGTSSIEPRPLNGTPNGERNVPSLRSSL